MDAYYKLFDATESTNSSSLETSRKELGKAYHDSAIFTYSVSTKKNQEMHPKDMMNKKNHNLLSLTDLNHKEDHVLTSNADIVKFLCSLSSTKHEPSSFKIDVPMYSEQCVVVVVNGIFQEPLKRHKPFWSFERTFVIVPSATGFVIVNDSWALSIVSVCSHRKKVVLKSNNIFSFQLKLSSQLSKTFAESKAPKVATFNPSASVNTNFAQMTANPGFGQAVATTSSAPSTTINMNREEILTKFMAATGMTREFSHTCLEENQYNPEVAFNVFQTLKSTNALPPEVFQT